MHSEVDKPLQIISFEMPNELAVHTLLDRLNAAMALTDAQHVPVDIPSHKQSLFNLEVVAGGFIEDFIKGHTFEYKGETTTEDVIEIYALINELEESKPRINEVDVRSFDCFLDYLNRWDALNIEGLNLRWWTGEWPEDEEFEQPWVMTVSVGTVSVKQGDQTIEKQVLIENGDRLSPAIDLAESLIEDSSNQDPSDNSGKFGNKTI
jgi:hypothetical protein